MTEQEREIRQLLAGAKSSGQYGNVRGVDIDVADCWNSTQIEYLLEELRKERELRIQELEQALLHQENITFDAEMALENANLIRYRGDQGIFTVEKSGSKWEVWRQHSGSKWEVWRQHSAGSDSMGTYDNIVEACQKANRLSVMPNTDALYEDDPIADPFVEFVPLSKKP